MDFSVNTLISAVRKRPQLWDVEHKLYKGKQNKKEAWVQVCEEVFENFKERPRDEQLIIERLLITKWRSVRDGYVRTLKRQNSKVYFYRKQVQFLDKVLLAKEPKPEEPHTFWETIEAAEISQESDNHEVAASPDYNTLSADPLQLGTTVELGTIVEQNNATINVDSVVLQQHLLSLTKLMEQQTASELDDNLLFFKSMLPSMKRLTTSQQLQFRVEIIQSLQRMLDSTSKKQSHSSNRK